MRNKLILFAFVVAFAGLLNLSLVSAVDVSVSNYYPTPAEAGEYLNVWLKIINKGENTVEGSSVRFKETYPFSLDPGDEESIVIDKLEVGGAVTKTFKIRVDAGANEGDNPLTFEYKDCSGCVWEEKEIPITVVESQTTFDVVLQELSTEGVYIAIANIGKNAANAVTIRIPEQDDFKTGTVSASIVGNLESGDYTLVGFEILSKVDRQTGMGSRDENTEKTQEQGLQDRQESEEKELTIQIDYTDTLGVRRSVFKEITIDPTALSGSTFSTDGISTSGTRSKSSNGVLSNTWFWITLVLVLAIIGKTAYKKYKTKQKKK